MIERIYVMQDKYQELQQRTANKLHDAVIQDDNRSTTIFATGNDGAGARDSPKNCEIQAENTGQQKLRSNRVALRLDPGRSTVEVAENDYATSDDMNYQETLDNPNPVSVPPTHHPPVETATSTVKDKETFVQKSGSETHRSHYITRSGRISRKPS
ncbi:Hypothetical predicted protein [Paramuricea clavata]|uniref:Uncharacterized protein n=1 Tax=Paramuricea clavata TaxID=317549 RepID=A0A7D9E3J9_PARCT|nr:Hypothetical predicted protein [Paramuricea clavata]